MNLQNETTLPINCENKFLGGCTFEQGRCTWFNSQTDDFDWRDGTGGTTTAGTGPTKDHTLGSAQGIGHLKQVLLCTQGLKIMSLFWVSI